MNNTYQTMINDDPDCGIDTLPCSSGGHTSIAFFEAMQVMWNPPRAFSL